MENKKIAIIRVRGLNKLKSKIEDTMKMLRLYNKNNCIIVDVNESMLGMINKIKDYITWGEADQETIKLLLEKRGRTSGNKALTEEYLRSKTKYGYDEFAKAFFESKIKLRDVPGLKPYFRLMPPRGGFERHGIKVHYSMGGSLGYRKEKINDLIKKMI